jgi:PHP family Zn ribbon phosphoesterase
MGSACNNSGPTCTSTPHSRATSKALGIRMLAAWARTKGLDVLATGDFTHPGWQEEIEEQLEPDGAGLYKLKNPKNLTREIPWLDGLALPGSVRFLLSAEISSIYSSGGKTRKIHNLVYVPDLDTARRLSDKLAQVGNLAADGRPILGLPSRDLLEMVLGLGRGSILVPAHIWTPWFSLFGSKSGYDSVEECFGSLAGEIFAMETGLSSDPAMNWMWSALDRYRMISNSDAHSGEKLGREANLFGGEKSFAGIRAALKGEGLGSEFLGTGGVLSRGGKYHLDGHRDCNVVFEPEETRARAGLCPVCGKPLTVGCSPGCGSWPTGPRRSSPRAAGVRVPHPPGRGARRGAGPGPGTKAVKALYARLASRFGSELDILQHTPPEDVAKVSRPLAEALARMRRGEVYKDPGFDGRYGSSPCSPPRSARSWPEARVWWICPRPGPAAPSPRRPFPGVCSRPRPGSRRRQRPRSTTPPSARRSPPAPGRCWSWPARARARPTPWWAGCRPSWSAGSRPGTSWP